MTPRLKPIFGIESEAVVQGRPLFHASGDFGSFFDCGQLAKKQPMTGVQFSIDETASNPDVTVVGRRYSILSSLAGC